MHSLSNMSSKLFSVVEATESQYDTPNASEIGDRHFETRSVGSTEAKTYYCRNEKVK
jgi:hypothetical protein